MKLNTGTFIGRYMQLTVITHFVVKLPNYLKNLESLKPFKKQLKAFLLQQTFYSVDEYLSYV
jgi:hypothetical protein